MSGDEESTESTTHETRIGRKGPPAMITFNLCFGTAPIAMIACSLSP